jgi:superfamily II DNA or RNA helicase
VGVTATPVRIDGSGLGDVNDDLLVGVSAKWLIENRCLAPYDYYAPSELDMSSVHTKNGEYDMQEAEDMLNEKCVYGDVIRHYKELARDAKAVCYCVSIGYSKMMADQFTKAGIPAFHIDGTTSKSERDRIISDFRKGNIKILCNVDLISEGFDVPDCGCAILLRPTKSLTLYIQQSMRCMRYQEGKRAVILDHVGNVRRFGMPDDDREWSLETIKKKQAVEFDIVSCELCFFTFPKIGEDGKRMSHCPKCGAPLKKPKQTQKPNREMETDETTALEKVTEVHAIPAQPMQCRTYADLSAYGKSRGYKPGWAYYMARRMGLITK